MGANAQTSVPTFTAGEVLTAANMNISARTGVPVFADTTARDAGFGGTGEKTLAEGQLCYLESTNVVQYYDGAAWATVGPTTVSSGLTVVKAETAFTSATSFSADNVFTSSYTDYLINITAIFGAGNIALKLRAGGTATSTNYNYQSLAANSTTVSSSRASSQTSFLIDDSATVYSTMEVRVFGPQLARQTNIHVAYSRMAGAATTPYVFHYFGDQSGTTQFDGIEFTGATNAMTGIYTIYALAKS